MSHTEIERDITRTRYEGNPQVRVASIPDGPLSLQVTLQTTSAPDGQEAAFSRIVFKDVLEYRWIASNHSYLLTDKNDAGFCLIEILNSEHVEMLVSNDIYSDSPPGSRLGGVLDERSLHHYRLDFDEYGTFDIIALSVEISSYRAIRDWPSS
jgi:hypothetical protein